jgi:long-subunit fatty acid transport protein
VTLLKSQVALSACPGQTICAPEDPDFDANTKIDAHDYFSPSVGAGIQWDVVSQGDRPVVTLGASANTATYIDASGTVATQLPSSAFFQGASVVGNSINAKLDLPATTKFGIELRPNVALRIEFALDIEYWGVQKGIGLTTHGVSIQNQAGVGTYELSPVSIPREYETSYAPSVGGEYHFGRASVGAGYSYETRAAQPGYVSALTVDSNKHIVGLGGDYKVTRKWTLGAAFAFIKLTDTNVSLATARVNELSPLRDQPNVTFVNAGYYKSSYIVAGLRASRPF